MSKDYLLYLSNKYIPPSAYPGFINSAITSDQKLRSKTGLVVLYFYKIPPEANVYRLSSKKPGYYSLDVYKFVNNKWEFYEKDKKKYRKIPIPSKDVKSKIINGVKILYKNTLSDENTKKIEKLISVIKK
ncbi:MAG: hypothetical protein COT24_03775 [Candidatus Kerfeldbacteria bacterium CG08_land_8_20_14_0_20_40_16]|uniref:Uncharacterized protein n=1 Tax=Candidatus Kerfeldbacteria bacterium CG08_land_8_20_14_0_20_40_16 TaxID=2014244 RepID=A0A2H0YXE0_9BACT|nr:MAG: hypothetical protein COT24_03775 [Candidatus Kerfeldbacteria bacterium CG08_land_8_20_14_0_20_40_16]